MKLKKYFQRDLRDLANVPFWPLPLRQPGLHGCNNSSGHIFRGLLLCIGAKVSVSKYGFEVSLKHISGWPVPIHPQATPSSPLRFPFIVFCQRKKENIKNCSFHPWKDKRNLESLSFIWKYLFSPQLYADRHFLQLVIEVEISTKKK